MNTLTTWFNDISILTKAAIDGLDDLVSKDDTVDIESTLEQLLGIDKRQTDYSSKVAAVRKWFVDAQSYSDGNFAAFGLRNAWIFCNKVRTADGGVLQLWQVDAFKPYFGQGLTPFWIPGINNYFFDEQSRFQPGTPGSRCQKMLSFTGAATFESFITICVDNVPTTSIPAINWYAANTVAQAAAHLADGDELDGVFPGSGVLLHEMMHATRGPGNTNDNAGNSKECYEMAKTDPVNSAQASPQCAALFAVAMYHLQKKNKTFWCLGQAVDSDTALSEWVKNVKI
ncbi:hypothetical protein BJ170DRAFT_681124 [Xylariales sp. AK1849]|nr:hypothetical protein BJ170DRAFT_681124 [Xylariales sp. AK1849]